MTIATMTVTRAVQVPKFYDAAVIAETEAEDIDVEVTLSGTYAPAEPDVGIMADGFVDIYAEDKHGNEIELTEREKDQAQETLLVAIADDAADAQEQAAEARADARRFWREHGG